MAESTHRIQIRKVPSLIQREIDQLVEKSKTGTLTPEEQQGLTEVLDYLDELTLLELEHVAKQCNA